jgi:hypothetical protein
MHRSRSRLAIVAAAAAAALAAAPLVPSPATGSPPVYSSAGVLSISTVTNEVVLDTDLDGIAEAAQALGEGPACSLDTDESLLAIDGYVGTSSKDAASYDEGSLGVAEKKSGVSCREVDAGSAERLVLALNPANVRTDLGPLLAASASLDVDLKQSARILATAYKDGGAVGWFELQSGATIGTSDPLPDGVPAPDAIHTCTTDADSGPDAGINDNCRWPISENDDIVFDALELLALNGSFGLDGGSDGAVPPLPPAALPAGASFFELVQQVDGVLDCNETTIALQPDGDAPGVVVQRIDNADPSETCELVPYTLSNGTNFIQFLKPLDEQISAQFIVTVTWPLSAADPLPIPATTLDYEAPGGSGPFPLAWCPDPLFSGNDLLGIAFPNLQPDQEPALPGDQFACLGSQYAQVVNTSPNPDDVIVTEQVYVKGDLRMRK